MTKLEPNKAKDTLLQKLFGIIWAAVLLGRGGHQILDSGETFRNEYLLCKNFKTGFGFFVPQTVFSSHFGPAWLAEN